jgi:hypothetical protein
MRTLICVAALSASVVAAGPLTQRERDRALSELQATRKQFLESLDGLSPAQWTYKPDDKTWSVAECAEHIALSETVILGMVREKILKTPEVTAKPEGAIDDEEVLRRVADRGKKGKAPEMLQPKQTWPSRDEVVAAFKQRRDVTLDYVRTTSDDLRSHFNKTPNGTMDAYQFLLVIAGHTGRHVQQIQEVKASPGFPKQ